MSRAQRYTVRQAMAARERGRAKVRSATTAVTMASVVTAGAVALVLPGAAHKTAASQSGTSGSSSASSPGSGSSSAGSSTGSGAGSSGAGSSSNSSSQNSGGFSSGSAPSASSGGSVATSGGS